VRPWTVPACGRKKEIHDRSQPGRPQGKPGSKIHALSDLAGLPLAVAVSAAANTNDSHALKPLVMAIPAIKSRCGPQRRKPAKLHADKAYDQPDLCRWVRDRDIKNRIARKGIESKDKIANTAG
jgi:hypothetical protein